jgi:flagellar motor switch protein FliM
LSEVLSQNEIDNLLNELQTGTVDIDDLTQEEIQVVKKYDFKRPSKFSKDHIRMLNTIHDKYGKLLSGALTKYLRTSFEMELESIESLSYRDFNHAITNPAVMAVINLTPLKGTMVLEIAPGIMCAIIDRVMGGMGGTCERVKEFTRIEISIMKNVLANSVEPLQAAWSNILELQPEIERIETNPQLAQITSLDEMALLVTYRAKIDQVEELINICIPYMVLEPVIPKLNSKYWFTSNNQEEDTKRVRLEIENALMQTEVPVRTLLGGTSLSFRELASLQLGDVIPLDKLINDSLDIMVDEECKFKGMPGLCNKKYAVRIDEIITQGEDYERTTLAGGD